MKTYSVQLESNTWMDDTFNGSLEDCLHYCITNRYIAGTRIAQVEIESDDTVSFTHDYNNIIDLLEYEHLLKLDNTILTPEDLDVLDEHELIVWCENLGNSGDKIGCTWWMLQVEHPQDGDRIAIDVYVKQ